MNLRVVSSRTLNALSISPFIVAILLSSKFIVDEMSERIDEALDDVVRVPVELLVSKMLSIPRAVQSRQKRFAGDVDERAFEPREVDVFTVSIDPTART